MKYDEFIRQVQEQAGMETPEEAVEITQAVLETLGERLERKVRNGVAAQLPKELKEFLQAREEPVDQGFDQAVNRYDLPEFYNRVGARAGLKYYDSAERTWQVLSVLRQAIAGGEVEDILESLPEEYAELFGEDTPGDVRPRP